MRKYISRLFQWLYKGIPSVRVTPVITHIADCEKLNGKTILIIGGSRGVGFSIAKKCQECGAGIIIVGRNLQLLKEASASLSDCQYIQYDINNINGFQGLFNSIEYSIDCIVYNASLYLHENSIEKVSEEGFDAQFSTNLKSPYFLCQTFVKYIRSRKITRANILFISSEMGLYCSDIPYGLGKAALNDFVIGLARRYIKDGVRVNALAPGVMSHERHDAADENIYTKYSCGQRYILPEEVAEVATFMLSEASSCISGAIIPCNLGNHYRCDW